MQMAQSRRSGTPLITFRQASGTLKVSSTPIRLMHMPFAEPVGIGAMGVFKAFRASCRTARPLITS